MFRIPFNRATLTGQELQYINEAIRVGHISGDGGFSQKCSTLIETRFSARKVLLTTSGTTALEMAALLLDLKPGDEIILPSFTFVTSAQAFVLRGARPVFVEIRPDTLNIDEQKIEEHITPKTRAINVTHYAGVACEMETITRIAKKHQIAVVEDAAQAVNSKYKGRFLGTLGTLGAYSFHETKNVTCGEGGAIVLNDDRWLERAEIIRQKGTNRGSFLRGETDKYTWCDLGSSYALSDILAAFLYAQLEHMDEIQAIRKRIFCTYFEMLKESAADGKIQLPSIPSSCETNYHMFWVLFENELQRAKVIQSLKRESILAVTHYVPLHSSPVGQKFGYSGNDLPITEDVSHRLLRLPFYNTLSTGDIEQISSIILRSL